MASPLEKFNDTINDAAARLLGRAGDARGLSVEDVRPKVEVALEKYLLSETQSATPSAILSFLDELHADDLCLVVACEKGDEQAWSDLVARYDATVRTAARRAASTQEDAEDIAGSIWAELHGLRIDKAGKKKSKLGYYSGRGSLAGWLRAVVSQLAVDEFRRHSRFVQIEEERELDVMAEDAAASSNNEHHVIHAGNPEELLSEKRTTSDIAAALNAAVEKLDADDRLLLKLYYYDELRLKDIGATLGFHEATASRKLARVHSELRISVEMILREKHGWTDGEVKHHLADAAERLGLSIEKILAVAAMAHILQEFAAHGVL